MSALVIQWQRDAGTHNGLAHATVDGFLFAPDPEGYSPLCMGRNTSVGVTELVDAPYAERCQRCVAELSRVLEEATTVPTAPVLMRVEIEVIVDPGDVDHAADLIGSYVHRTKTFNRHRRDREPSISWKVMGVDQ